MKFTLTAILVGFIGFNAQAQSLPALIEQAEQNNRQLQAYELKYSRMQEKVQESGALPNTEFTFGYAVSEPETRTGPQRMRFGIRQMMPWFGTITARESYSGSLAEADFLDIAVARRKLRLDVARGYYDLHDILSRDKVLEQNIRLLKTYEQLALTSVEVGNASVVEVLRLQIRQQELQEKIDILENRRLSLEANLNALLNRSITEPVMITDSLYLPSDSEELLNGLEVHPELERFDRLYESIAQAEEVNRKESQPNLGFGLDYIPVQERTDMDVVDNGKDVVMPMVTLSVPIFNSRYRSISRQNELKQQEIASLKQERRNKLEARLENAIQDRAAARIRYKTQVKNLEKAKHAEDVLMRSFETGRVDFNDVLDLQELQLKFQLEQIGTLTDYFKQSAVINYITNN